MRNLPYTEYVRRAPVPCRLFAGWVQLIRWRTNTDSSNPASGSAAKIDAARCDLSPSGERLIYFAVSYKQRSLDRGYTGTWTAISRPPYFTALALWPLGDTWWGGGLFVDDTIVRLNHPEHQTQCHPDHLPPTSLRILVEPMVFWDCTVLSERMDRDGWTLHSQAKRVYRGQTIAGEYPQRLEKPDPKARRSLFLLDLSDGILNSRPFHYTVVYRKTGADILSFEAEWADWDQQGQLAYASQGKLWRATFAPRGRTIEMRAIADFNASRPDPQPSPEWAIR